jgi:hypothetical protein
MNFSTLARIIAPLFLVLPTGLSSQAIEEKNLLSGKVKYDSKLAYVFVRAPVRQAMMLLRLPDEADVIEYEKAWAEALLKAKKKYKSQIQTYEYDLKASKKYQTRVPARPIEPTEKNFSIEAIELMNVVSIGPQFVFSKTKGDDEKDFTYLHAVKPGRYVYYGPIFLSPNAGYAGFCYCMGTVSFEVKAGQVADTGNFFLVAPSADPDFKSSEPISASESGLYRPQELTKLYGPLTYGLPESLKTWPNMVPDWKAHGHLDNFYGVTVVRMPPIPGVLAYNRDKVVDLKAPASGAPSSP